MASISRPTSKRKLFDCEGQSDSDDELEEQNRKPRKPKITVGCTPGVDKMTPERFLREPLKALTERQQLTFLLQMTAAQECNGSLKTPQVARTRNPRKAPPSCKYQKHLGKCNERGETPLHVAAIRGDLKQARSLIRIGSDINATDFAGWTPLHEACNYGWLGVAQLLLKAGANVNARGLDGITPLHDAAVNGHCKLVKLLLQHGALPHPKSTHGRTPLSIASGPEVSNILRTYSSFRSSGTPAKIVVAAGSAVSGGFLFHDEGSSFPDTESLVTQLTSHRLTSNITPKHGACPNNMRKSSPQHQSSKGPDKPSSPRLTLRFQPIKPRDDRHGGASKPTEVSSSEPRYQSYCVTMETGESGYHQLKKDGASVSSTRSSSSTPDSDVYDPQLNVVSSTKDASNATVILHHHQHSLVVDGAPSDAGGRARTMENHVAGPANNQAERHKGDGEGSGKAQCGKNGESNNHVRPEGDEASEGEQDDNRRKRKRDGKDSSGDTGLKMGSGALNSGVSMSLRNHSREKGIQEERKNSQDAQVAPPTKNPHFNSGSETESTQSDAENESGSHEVGPGLPKVPPLKIVIPPTTLSEQDRNKLASRQALPYVVNAPGGDVLDSKSDAGNHGSSATNNNAYGGSTSSGDCPTKEDGKSRDGHAEERSHRVTRSSQRMAALASASTSNSITSPTQLQYSSPTECSVDLSGGKAKYELGEEYAVEEPNGPDMHPRKRKLRARDGHQCEGNSGGHMSSASSSWSSASSHCEDQSILNCYEMFLNIRKQIDRRRRNMFVVQPKPPQGFKDYLLNRCSYVLAGNAASRLSVPMISPPQSLDGPMKELFVNQEKERYNLRLQHLIEKEKLVLMVEQEILRVHGRAARAMANQTIPLSVCTILKDEEVYNQIEPEQEEKERNARTRFTGRHLLSWLQDVDDKWEKVKDAMLLRHHNEAESLHAAQKLDWEWKMKELAICDFKSTPVIDSIHVPMVHISPVHIEDAFQRRDRRNKLR